MNFKHIKDLLHSDSQGVSHVKTVNCINCDHQKKALPSPVLTEYVLAQ